jgi:ACR3 family arsenite efflux pump ArsB
VPGQAFPGAFAAIGRLEVAKVNLPVGALIAVMVVPMLLKIDFGALHPVNAHWKGIGAALFVNGAVKPFSMALPGWLLVRVLFAPIVALLLGISSITVPWDTLLAVPILLQVFFNSGLACLLNRRLGVASEVAGPSCLIGAGNFFELAVVKVVNASRGWYEAGRA